MKLRPLLLLLLLGTALAGSPKSASPPEGLPTAQILGPQSGLTGVHPKFVIADLEGRIWVSMSAGTLFVGDGIRFLKVALPETIKNRDITGLANDPQGRLWVLTTAGLGTLDGGTWRVDISIRDGDEALRARESGICEHPSGTLAVLAAGKAYRIPLGGRPLLLALPGSDSEGAPSLVWQGDHLVANRGGLCWREEGQGWIPMPTLPLQGNERPRGPVRCDAQEHLYLLTDRYLYHLEPGGRVWQALGDYTAQQGDHMAQLKDGCIWILQNSQALRGLGGTLTRIGLPRDLSLYGLEARCLDSEGNLWLTRSNLVRIPVLGLVLSHAGPDGFPAGDVWRIRRDTNGALWVASNAGLFRRNDAGWQAVKGLTVVRRHDAGPDGWIYTKSQRRLMRVNPQSLQTQEVSIPLRQGGVEIYRDPVVYGDHLWVLDTEGHLVTATWTHGQWIWAWGLLPGEPSPPMILIQDEFGRPWIIHRNGTYCLVNGRWEKLPLPEEHALVDLTFTTPKEGLGARYDPPTVYSLKRSETGWTTHQLFGPEDLRGIGILYAIRQDSKGSIWLNTNQGVVQVEPGNPPKLQRFGRSLGLPADDTNQGALWLDGPGHAWVGTANGLGEIRASDEPMLPPLTAPTLLEARCGTRVQEGAGATMTIPYGQGSAVWELGFPGPVRGEGAHFEFREAGGTWAALAGTALQFLKISPGHYRYEVRIVPFLGSPGPTRRLELHVLPPWYRHPLAYALWGLVLGSSVFLGFRWRLQRLQRRNRELSLAVTRATEGLRARERDMERVNRRLYELNDAKNRIIGLAAHDLRNPLSGILIYCELLQENPKDPKAAKSLEAIRSLGLTMKDLIQRLLNVHAIEAGHAEAPQIIAHDLETAVVDAMERAQNASERKEITLAFAFPGPALAQCDPTQVGQILDNLLGNAIKFSPSGTTITLGLDADDTHWRVSLTDQGPGLTAADLDLVFGEYVRLSAQPTAGEASVGLGLSLVKRMAEAMGGRVGVESIQGQGATFWLALPKA